MTAGDDTDGDAIAFTIDFFDNPNDFKIAISFVLFFIRIVSPEIILNAATIIIKVNIKNITFLSTFKAVHGLITIATRYTLPH